MFDIHKSRVSEDALSAFLSSPVSYDLKSVPGIGPAGESKLREAGITTTHQLLGKFMSFICDYSSPQEQADAMWDYLDSIGACGGGYRSGVVHALAEKINIMIPGTFEFNDLL